MIGAVQNLRQTLQLGGSVFACQESSTAATAQRPVAASPARTWDAWPGSVPEAEARQICSSGQIPGPSAARPSKRRAAVPGQGAAHRTMSASEAITLARAARPHNECHEQSRNSRVAASDLYPKAVHGLQRAPPAITADYLLYTMFRES